MYILIYSLKYKFESGESTTLTQYVSNERTLIKIDQFSAISPTGLDLCGEALIARRALTKREHLSKLMSREKT